MQPITAPIKLKEQSSNVANLQDALIALGYKLNTNEVTKQTAGSTTIKTVRNIQLKNKLHFDDTLLADQPTADLLNRILKDKGLLTEDKKFSVSGKVMNSAGEGLGGKPVLAYDVDLKGARIYKTAKTTDELKSSGGMELLGKTVSQPDGSYSIIFSADQFSHAEQGLADVVVYAVKGKRIIGLSTIASDADYVNGLSIENLDVVLSSSTERGISEFTLLLQQVNTFLDISSVKMQDIYDSPDQVAFLASEIKQDLNKIQLLVQAAQMAGSFPGDQLAHELLYGLGRENILLSFDSIAISPEDKLLNAWQQAIQDNFIDPIDNQTTGTFLATLHEVATQQVITSANGTAAPLSKALSFATANTNLQAAFVNADRSFNGTPLQFWNEYLPQLPEFKRQPEVIQSLQLTNQLIALTGNHLPLVESLQVNRKIQRPSDLLQLNDTDWSGLLKSTGVPDGVPGTTDDEKISNYKGQLQTILNAAFPTQKIALMVSDDSLKITDPNIKESLTSFFNEAKNFDISSSQIKDFEAQLTRIAGSNSQACQDQLAALQRIYQVSPVPETMPVLLGLGYDSAYRIANIPQQSFIDMHSQDLGSDNLAMAIHQRASYQAMRLEHVAMTSYEIMNGVIPQAIILNSQVNTLQQVIQKHIPNYTELFGSPDICQCEECRSVYGAASYFVDIMQFLDKCGKNYFNITPQAILLTRRPDLAFLPLTCENTNTIIPYIDLVNEIMEYYVVHAALDSTAAHDTGDATADELRANPQYTLKEAYRKLKDAAYPFGLPYHQPLDAERIYFDQMHSSRAEVMEIMRNDPSSKTDKAIYAELLNLSQEEYSILTGNNFDGTNAGKNVWEYYGYPDDNTLQSNIFKIPEFLKRTGIQYADLISLSDTQFINPYQPVLDYIENLFSTSTLTPDDIYQKLQQIAANKLDPSADNDLSNILKIYSISSNDFKTWVTGHFSQFQSVVTLYEPASACELSSTALRTLQSIYENLSGSGIPDDTYSKFHRFIRLWRKTGWLVTELDTIIFALGENDITGTLIDKLSPLLKISGSANLPLNKMATLWGNIQTFGNQSLYKKLFLNKAIQRIDTAFSPDVWGNYLTDHKSLLKDHIPAVLAAYRLSADDFNIILNDNAIDINTQVLSIENLSIIYRYVVLSKAIGIPITDICTLKQLFSISPFSTYDTGQQKFININPQATLDFITLTESIKSSGFKVKSLNYIIQGIIDPKYNLALPEAAAQQALLAIRKGFLGIEQTHPDTDLDNVTEDLLRSKLQLIYKQDIVERLVSFLNGTAVFSVIAGNNLPVTIPSPQNSYIIYVKGSGRLQCTGVLSDDDKNILDGLSGGILKTAALDLYQQPEQFIKDNFSALFNGNINNAIQYLLNHPKQKIPLTIAEKWQVFYKAFLPYLKDQLRRNLIIQSISNIISLDEPVTQILVNQQIDNIVQSLSQMGLSATYYKDEVFNSAGLTRIDAQVNFDWQGNAPDITIPSDHFSVRWEGWLNPPVSNDFTLVVEVDDADDAFALYIDDQIAVQKNSGDSMLSKESVMTLSAAKAYKLKLEYAEKINLAGIHLSWKTATSSKEIIDQVNLFPLIVYNQFYGGLKNYQKAALFITGFNLKAAEVDHLIRHNVNFNNIDFTALTASCWQRIFNYTVVRKSLPGSLSGLTGLFELADSNNPAPTLDDIITQAIAVSGWNKDYLTYLVKTQFNLQVADFRNEAAMLKLTDAIKLTLKTGASPNALSDWSKVETDFDVLYDQSQTIKNTVKSQFGENDWLQVAKKLSNLLREHQKEALIDYLLVQQELITWGVTDADSLFEYFLIDVQMDACMDTSRIKQAISSVQLFVSRCLMNIESRIDNSGNETGVSPVQMDNTSRIRWEWMKNYRVWEANRKVFLYPENWLDPELRDDKSEFFKALESELLQNDITSDTADNAFYNYLDNLDEVSHLEICGTFQDNNNNVLHVFGRSHAKPYIYYYRTYNMIFRHWSAWEKLQADIRGVDDTQDPGVHLTPFVWKDRLFIFWPEFLKKQENNLSGNSQSYYDAAKNPVSDSVPESYWEVTLAWSEYKNGRWTPKSVSKEYLRPGYLELLSYSTINPITHETQTYWNQPKPSLSDYVDDLKDYFLFPSINNISNELTLSLIYNRSENQGDFILSDIHNPVIISYEPQGKGTSSDIYTSFYEKLENIDGSLTLKGNTYLQTPVDHKILFSPQFTDFEATLNYPFFFMDHYRSYFVMPVDVSYFISQKNGVKNPDFNRYLPIQLIKDQTSLNQLPKIPVNPSNPVEKSASFTGTSVSAEKMAPDPSSAISENVYPKTIPGSFMGTASGIVPNEIIISHFQHDKGLIFNTFYHPYTADFLQQLNEGEIDSLMECDTLLPDDNGSLFNSYYNPNFNNGLIQKPADFSNYTYYKENVAFDEYSAYGLYNWELFYHAPLYIATRLSKNGKYADAMNWFRYIFDPATSEKPDPNNPESRYWKVLPFKSTLAYSLENYFESLQPGADDLKIDEWRDKPFDPFLVARGRPIAFMKNVVMKYIDNLVSWGDDLFRQDTIESINQATQLYVIAAHILGPKPEIVPSRGKVKAETYDSLKPKLDAFSNAIVQLENLFPFSSEISSSNTSYPGSMLGIGSALYFCIPNNDNLLQYWDTVADRLFKIRHCMNIQGVERTLALFEPPIDPGLLIKAAANGISIGSILADLNSPAPFYRFTYLSQKATEFCSEVKALGSSLLSALEKKDNEELARLRASQEANLLNMITAVKERQVLLAKADSDSLKKSRETIAARANYYLDLLGITDYSIPEAPSPLQPDLGSDSPLPSDTAIGDVPVSVDVSLVDTNTSGVRIIPKEKEDLDKSEASKLLLTGANGLETLAGTFHLLPGMSINLEPFGVGGSISFGGDNIGASYSVRAKALQTVGSYMSMEAAQAGKMATFIRREQEWQQQARQALMEIVQIDKQLVAADIRFQIAQKELDNHLQQLQNARDIEQYLGNKFTSQEFYQWMKEELFSVYKQSYQLAYDMAKKAEKAYQVELGKTNTSFIQYGYFESNYQGLTAGEQLHFAIRQMDKSFIEENRREFELTKHISLAVTFPNYLLQARETGACELELQEELFDLDYPGHYFRRIKSLSITIPCVAGPYTTINATLRLLRNSIRINTLNGDDGYVHNNDNGILTDDDRFIGNNIPFKAIATSSAQNDSGVFDLNFRDERYLPFEGAGVISRWQLELNGKYLQEDGSIIDLSQFDYNSISDIILHIRYTSREDAGLFRQNAIAHLQDYIKQAVDNSPVPFMRMFSLKHEFPAEWYTFLNQPASNGDQACILQITKDRFPYLLVHMALTITNVVLLGDSGLSNLPGMQLTSPGNTTNSYTFSTQPDYGPMFVAGPSVPWNEEDPGAWKLINPFGNTKLNNDNCNDIIMIVSYKTK